MVDMKHIIAFGLESLTMTERKGVFENEAVYQSMLHDFKTMVVDLQSIENKNLSLEEKINILFLKLTNLEHLIDDLCDEQHERIKIPHRCPVCNGTMYDEEDAYCHPCDGKGIVWG